MSSCSTHQRVICRHCKLTQVLKSLSSHRIVHAEIGDQRSKGPSHNRNANADLVGRAPRVVGADGLTDITDAVRLLTDPEENTLVRSGNERRYLTPQKA